MKEEFPIPTAEEMKNKMELETNLMRYVEKAKGINPLDWAEKYSGHFRELFDHSNIWERYHAVYDSNADEIYEWIQHSIESMAEEKK